MDKKRGVLLVFLIITISSIAFADTCSETDYGPNFYMKGTSGYIVSGQSDLQYPVTDSCSGSILSEYYCDSNEVRVITYTCPEDCQDGHCIKPSAQQESSEPETNLQPQQSTPSPEPDTEPKTQPLDIPVPKKEQPKEPEIQTQESDFTEHDIVYLARTASYVFEGVDYKDEVNILANQFNQRIEYYKSYYKTDIDLFLLQIETDKPELYEKILPFFNQNNTTQQTEVFDFSKNSSDTETINTTKYEVDFSDFENEYQNYSNLQTTTKAGLAAFTLIIVVLIFLFMIFKRKIMIFLRLDFRRKKE